MSVTAVCSNCLLEMSQGYCPRCFGEEAVCCPECKHPVGEHSNYLGCTHPEGEHFCMCTRTEYELTHPIDDVATSRLSQLAADPLTARRDEILEAVKNGAPMEWGRFWNLMEELGDIQSRLSEEGIEF